MDAKETVHQDEPMDHVRYERPHFEKTERLTEVTGFVKFTGEKPT
jgi:hypothetical protein